MTEKHYKILENLIDERWVVVALESGHYMGIDATFNSLKEAEDYAITEGFVKIDESEFPYYGVVDYVIPNREKFRLSIEKIITTKETNNERN